MPGGHLTFMFDYAWPRVWAKNSDMIILYKETRKLSKKEDQEIQIEI